MRFAQITVLIVLAALAGCGVETMGTAATSAAEQLARQRVDQAVQVQQERLQAAE